MNLRSRPRKPCAAAGCGVLVDGVERYCERHRKAKQVASDQTRGSAAQRGYDSKWAQARAAYLRKHPLCRECQANDRIAAADVVDHIKPHRLKEAIDSGDEVRIAEARRLFWDSERNWQPLCKPCHDRKTAKEDGGFGRRPGQPGRGV